MSMSKDEETRVLSELYELQNKELFVVLINHYQKVKSIKGNMVDALDLLDELAETGDKQVKDKLRKVILDSFNEAPRSTAETIEEISNIVKG